MDPRAPRWPRVILAALLVLAVAAFYFLGLYRHFSLAAIKENLDAWKRQADDHPGAALLLFFLVYVAVTGLSLPAAGVLSLLAGALFGRWLGAGVASLAATAGATLAFLSSRYLLRDWVQRRFGARLEVINRGVERDGAFYLFTLRVIVAVPFFLINLALGLTPMRVTTFALVSWVGMLPGAFLYTNLGTELGSIDSPAGLLSWRVLGSLALLGLAPLALRWGFRWWQRRRLPA